MVASVKPLAVAILACVSLLPQGTLASHRSGSKSGDWSADPPKIRSGAWSADPPAWSADPPPNSSADPDSGSNSGDWSADPKDWSADPPADKSADPPEESGNSIGRHLDDDICGCTECTSDVLNRIAGEYTCGERLEYLMEAYNLAEEEACIRISRTEFPFLCGPECDPGRCDGRELPEEEMPSSHCGCEHCTQEVWNRRVDGHTCGARISYLTDFDGLKSSDACNIVAGHEFPYEKECGPCDPKRCEPDSDEEGDRTHEESAGGVDGESRCGCSRCVDSIWNLDAGGSTCGERIESLQKDKPEEYPTEIDACHQIAGEEYPHICGSNCNPSLCDAPLKPRTPIYCFPDFGERARFRNMWGNHTVEVKESRVEHSGLCGPSENKFSTDTVSKLSKNELKLQFKKVGDAWEGSEVRIRLPDEDMPFRYGTYSFSVKSVEVVNTATDKVESKVLPPSLVLGLHTFDSTENFAIHENQNHQVGIDITRFDVAGADARFAVQPATDFSSYSFFTGESRSYNQAPRLHKFDWRPNKIEFYSSSGEFGETFTYSTQEALDAGEPDFNQCLPADIEIRLSLWNLYGTQKPTEIESDDTVVEVVIDDFEYTPRRGLEHVPNGGACSKDCQCSPSSRCYDNTCSKVVTHYEIVAPKSAKDSARQETTEGSDTWQHLLGLFILSCSVSAVTFLFYQLFKMKAQASDEAFPFMPPRGTKA